MVTKEKVEAILQSFIDSEKEFVVEVSVAAGNRIQVLLDSDDAITIERCVEVSREIEKHLDRDAEDFELEVSSAGLSAPLKMVRQYKKNIGRSLDVVLNDGTKYTGELMEVGTADFLLQYEEMVQEEGMKRKKLKVQSVRIDYESVKSNKIVISYK